jgi:hypothetical protein
MVFAHPVERLAAEVFVQVKADLADQTTSANRLFDVGLSLYRRIPPVSPFCRECCVEDSVPYRTMDTAGWFLTKWRKRRVWFDDDNPKSCVCGQTRVRAVSVSYVARQHDLNTILVFASLRDPHAARMPTLVS